MTLVTLSFRNHKIINNLIFTVSEVQNLSLKFSGSTNMAYNGDNVETRFFCNLIGVLPSWPIGKIHNRINQIWTKVNQSNNAELRAKEMHQLSEAQQFFDGTYSKDMDDWDVSNWVKHWKSCDVTKDIAPNRSMITFFQNKNKAGIMQRNRRSKV